jgi:hypothetical protein
VEKIVLKIAHFGQINNVTVGNNAVAEEEEEKNPMKRNRGMSNIN